MQMTSSRASVPSNQTTNTMHDSSGPELSLWQKVQTRIRVKKNHTEIYLSNNKAL